MSLERIQAAQEKQIALKADTEEIKVDIEEQRKIQAEVGLIIEKTKTNITHTKRRITAKDYQIAKTNYDIAIVREGAAKDKHGFEKASRLMGQHEYKAKLQIREIALNDQLLNIKHSAAMSGSAAVELISGADLVVPQIEMDYPGA